MLSSLMSFTHTLAFHYKTSLNQDTENQWDFILRKLITVFFLFRESHPLEDCSHIHTATWQHRLQWLQLTLPALQPPHCPETTLSAVLSLGWDSALIRSPIRSPQTKTCLQSDHMVVRTPSVSPNQAVDSQVLCLTITGTKPRPSRRQLHPRPVLRIPSMDCKRQIIWLEDLINNILHNSFLLYIIFLFCLQWIFKAMDFNGITIHWQEMTQN